MRRSLADLAARIGAPLSGGDACFTRVCTDTRQLQAGDLYVALAGPNFDGHDFLRRAAALGAAGALVARPTSGALPQVTVADTLAGLQAYAASWRRDFSVPVVGITGSNGKTTVRALTEAVLGALGPVLATTGNLNNHIGLPLMLTRLDAGHRVAVLEMGASAMGEIAALAALARPDVGIVTQAGVAHLGGFGSRENIARGKGEMYSALPAGGVAVINADDAWAPLWRDMAAHCRRIEFGFAPGAELRASDVRPEPADAPTGSRFILHVGDAQHEVLLPLPGRHNVANALAAAAAGHALGLDAALIAARLAQVQPPAGRLAWRRAATGARLLDDSYNANPGSLAAGLDLLAQVRGHRILVLGDMGELGEAAAELHREAGRRARAAGVAALFALGPLAAEAARAFGEGAEAFDDIDALNERLQSALAADWVLLVKGSRSARMERVVNALTHTAEAVT